MPISRFLVDGEFTPEQRHIIELAFNCALRKLKLVDRGDPVCEIVARKVIEVAASGRTSALAIAETAYRELAPDK